MADTPTVADFVSAVQLMQEAEGLAKLGEKTQWSTAIDALYALANQASKDGA